MLDSQLFSRSALPGSFADDDSYSLHDKTLFIGSTAAAAVYKTRSNLDVVTTQNSAAEISGSR
jgi:SNW domain-containing protein 1